MSGVRARLGLVGAGRWGRRYIETINAMDGVELAWVASGNPDTQRRAPGARVVPEWRKLLNAGLDGVVIATPPAVHGEMLRAFVEVGIPSMVEKPLCLGLAEACELREIIRATGVPVLVDHTQLFHPAFTVLKERAESLGRVKHIRSESMAFGPFRPDVSVLWDWAAHDISLCLDLLGRLPERVSALGDGNSVALSLDFDGGPAAWITNSNMSMEKRRAFTVHFDRRVLVLNDLSDCKLVEHELDSSSSAGGGLPGATSNPPVSNAMPLTQAVEYFVEGLGHGDRGRFGLDLACDVIRVLDAADRSMSAACPMTPCGQPQ